MYSLSTLLHIKRSSYHKLSIWIASQKLALLQRSCWFKIPSNQSFRLGTGIASTEFNSVLNNLIIKLEMENPNVFPFLTTKEASCVAVTAVKLSCLNLRRWVPIDGFLYLIFSPQFPVNYTLDYPFRATLGRNI